MPGAMVMGGKHDGPGPGRGGQEGDDAVVAVGVNDVPGQRLGVEHRPKCGRNREVTTGDGDRKASYQYTVQHFLGFPVPVVGLREDGHLVTGGSQPAGNVLHMGFDPADIWQIVACNQSNSHGIR